MIAVLEASVTRDELVERWRRAFGLDRFRAEAFVEFFVATGLIEVDGDRVTVTDRGRHYSSLMTHAGGLDE